MPKRLNTGKLKISTANDARIIPNASLKAFACLMSVFWELGLLCPLTKIYDVAVLICFMDDCEKICGKNHHFQHACFFVGHALRHSALLNVFLSEMAESSLEDPNCRIRSVLSSMAKRRAELGKEVSNLESRSVTTQAQKGYVSVVVFLVCSVQMYAQQSQLSYFLFVYTYV